MLVVCVGCGRVGGGVYWDCVCVSVSCYVVLCVCGGVNMCACCRHTQGRFECTHRTHNTTQYALSRHTHGQHSTTQHTSHLTNTRPTHCTPTPDAHTETADPLPFHTHQLQRPTPTQVILLVQSQSFKFFEIIGLCNPICFKISEFNFWCRYSFFQFHDFFYAATSFPESILHKYSVEGYSLVQ